VLYPVISPANIFTMSKEHPVKVIRKDRKLTQSDLSSLMGCTASHISLVESGETHFSARMVLKFVKKNRRAMNRLGISTEDILRGEMPANRRGKQK
jgi:transcriptional regulator with XRE-family HTH domain